MPRKKKEEKSASQPAKEEKRGVFVELSQEELGKLKMLAERDHNCPISLHARKIITHHLANMNFYFTR